MIYNNKKTNPEPIHYKDLIFGILLIAFLLFISYAIYKSFGVKKPKAEYKSSVVIQYANVYQLNAVLYHSPEDIAQSWEDEIIRLSMTDVMEFCEVVVKSVQIPVLDNYILEGDFVPKWLNSIKIGVVTAVTQFECNGSPP